MFLLASKEALEHNKKMCYMYLEPNKNMSYTFLEPKKQHIFGQMSGFGPFL